MDIKQHLT